MQDQPADEEWGRLPSGEVVRRLVVGRAPGPVLSLLTLGATVHRLRVGAAQRDVVLSSASVEEHLASSDFVGGTIGRYANRLAHGHLEVDGVVHRVGTNDRGHALHGGPDGFHRRLWTVDSHTPDEAVLSLVSPDGDQGFPGRLEVRARYAVAGSEVSLELTATTDAPTVVNLTQHLYLDLDGLADVRGQDLRVDAARWLPVDAAGIPLGEHVAVTGTPFDLRAPVAIGDVVASAHPQVRLVGGLDHDLLTEGEGLRPVAWLASRRTGLVVAVSSDQPGLQVYTGQKLGPPHAPYAGVALEPQLSPDTPHHPDWPSAVLRPGETYRSRMAWTFSGAD